MSLETERAISDSCVQLCYSNDILIDVGGLAVS